MGLACDDEVLRLALEELRAGEKVTIGTSDVERDMRQMRELGATDAECAAIQWMVRQHRSVGLPHGD
jgi:hypothetical protein